MIFTVVVYIGWKKYLEKSGKRSNFLPEKSETTVRFP